MGRNVHFLESIMQKKEETNPTAENENWSMHA